MAILDIGHGNRGEWKFQYSAEEILKGAVSQRDFRLGRVEVWLKAKDEIIKEIREAGISIDEGALDFIEKFSYSNTTRSPGPSVRVDQRLAQSLQEAHSKVQHHRVKAEEYSAWVKILTSQPPSHRLELTQSDWLFFFGKV